MYCSSSTVTSIKLTSGHIPQIRSEGVLPLTHTLDHLWSLQSSIEFAPSETSPSFQLLFAIVNSIPVITVTLLSSSLIAPSLAFNLASLFSCDAASAGLQIETEMRGSNNESSTAVVSRGWGSTSGLPWVSGLKHVRDQLIQFESHLLPVSSRIVFMMVFWQK